MIKITLTIGMLPVLFLSTNKQEKAASGMWYKNEQYKLSGKGNSYILSKYGDIIFKN